MNAIALQRTVGDMIAEYQEKDAALVSEIEAFNAAISRIGMAVSVGGTYGGAVFSHGRPSLYERDLRKVLLISAWKAIYGRCQIDRIASADDKRKWERTIADPPPLTSENAIATFGDYLLRTRFHLLRGMAECFVQLDPAYKSHSKVKIGVAGLPKRIIIRSMRGYGSYGYDRLKDVLNALSAYRGETVLDHREFADLSKLCRSYDQNTAGEVTIRGQVVRVFQNGNAHLIFDKAALLDINRALAEFYGEVLPDAEDENAKPQASTAVSKDLQFYATPAKVAEAILYDAAIEKVEDWNSDRFRPLYVLEPSCGDGRLMDAIRARGHKVLGIEVHHGRAVEAMNKGHRVLIKNFLEQPPEPIFDRVVMNPPFYGLHWRKHLTHALRFLKPGGRLVAILPATAEYDHGVAKEFDGRWHDLPAASFSESGTNVPTGYVAIVR